MKIKNFWVAFGAILVFIIFANCAFSGQTREDVLRVIPDAWKQVHPDWMDSLADQIVRDNEELAKFFEAHNFADMAKLHAQRNGQITTANYDQVSGIADLERFWTSTQNRVTPLRFRTISITLTAGLGSIQAGGPQFNALAIVVHEFAFGQRDEVEIRVYRHQRSCTW